MAMPSLHALSARDFNAENARMLLLPRYWSNSSSMFLNAQVGLQALKTHRAERAVASGGRGVPAWLAGVGECLLYGAPYKTSRVHLEDVFMELRASKS